MTQETQITIDTACGPAGIRLYAIGDIHGRNDLLTIMLEQIRQEIEQDKVKDWRILFLGDLVDRGPSSRQVLEQLIVCESDPRHIFLAGNHDATFLGFLERMDMRSPFLMFGGSQTAESYGVDLNQDPEAAYPQLVAAVPQSHVGFLQRLKPSAPFGDYFFCHAGIRPGISLEKQRLDDLQWIREPFLNYALPHPVIVVHGHTPCGNPELHINRINIDTGAFRTGILTALVIENEQRYFLQATDTGSVRLDQ